MPLSNSKKGYVPVPVVIYDRKKDVVLKETSLIAYDKASSKVMAAGTDAEPFIHCGDNRIIVVSPLKNGVIADYSLALPMFQYLLQKASLIKLKSSIKPFIKPRIAICVPMELTEVERKAFQDVFYQAGAKEVLLSEGTYEKLNQSIPESYPVVVEILQEEKRERGKDERWKEVCRYKIPEGIYQMVSINSNRSELSIGLSGNGSCIQVKFQKALAMRMLDKKIIPDNLYPEREKGRFRTAQFKNVIYQIENGEFGDFIKENGNENVCLKDYNHYIVMSENYVVEIVAEGEPEVKDL